MSDIEERLNKLDHALEQLRMPLTNYLLRVETDLSHRIKETDSARARGDDMMHDLVTRTANAIYKELKALEGQFASTSRVERISEELGELRRELNLAIANGGEELKQVNDRLEKLEDAANWQIDTSWHPFNFSTDLRPENDKRVMTLVRGGNNITGPWRAGGLNWAECDDATIIAWRYAKEGE